MITYFHSSNAPFLLFFVTQIRLPIGVILASECYGFCKISKSTLGGTMYKTVLSLALVTLLLGYLTVQPVYAGSTEHKQARYAEKIRIGIARLGTGEQARLRVKLRDKTQLDGYVSEAAEQDFVIVSAKTGAATSVPYAQVKQVQGNNLSTGAKIAIGLGVLAAILALLLFLENYG
jgi:hypothetical protein